MGRRAKSDAEKRRTGAGKRSPKPKSKPAPPPALGREHEPPAWMTEQGGADAVMFWREIIVPRMRINMLRDNEHHVAARYCVHFADWLDARRNIKAQGYTIDTPMTANVGVMKRLNPEVRRERDAESSLAALEKEIGLTPMARFQLRNRANLHTSADRDLFDQAGVAGGRAVADAARTPSDDAGASGESPPPSAPPASAISALTKH